MKSKTKKIKIGIIGCGTIGTEIAEAIINRLYEKAELIAVCDVSENNAKALLNKIKKQVPVLPLEKLIAQSDLVVESAYAEVSADIVSKCITMGKDVMVMSTAGLIGKPEIINRLSKGKTKLYLPSGAICGLDGVKAAVIGKINRAVLTTRKPPVSLKGAPYIVEHKIDLEKITGETVIFEGSVSEAVKAFPKNINVSATLSLTGVGLDKINVRMVVSPEYINNSHEIEIEGEFGKLVTKTENVASLKNPKTSQMAIFSVIATIEGILSNIKVGT